MSILKKKDHSERKYRNDHLMGKIANTVYTRTNLAVPGTMHQLKLLCSKTDLLSSVPFLHPKIQLWIKAKGEQNQTSLWKGRWGPFS